MLYEELRKAWGELTAPGAPFEIATIGVRLSQRRGGPTMLVQSACRVVPSVLVRERLRRPNCPRCENVVLIVEQSRFNASGHIDHLWSCDECGNQFITSIRLGRR